MLLKLLVEYILHKRRNTKSKGLPELCPGEGDYLHQIKLKGVGETKTKLYLANVTSPVCSTNWSQQDGCIRLPSPLPVPQDSVHPGNGGGKPVCCGGSSWACVLHSFPVLLRTVDWVRLGPFLHLSLGDLRLGTSLHLF